MRLFLLLLNEGGRRGGANNVDVDVILVHTLGTPSLVDVSTQRGKNRIVDTRFNVHHVVCDRLQTWALGK